MKWVSKGLGVSVEKYINIVSINTRPHGRRGIGIGGKKLPCPRKKVQRVHHVELAFTLISLDRRQSDIELS